MQEQKQPVVKPFVKLVDLQMEDVKQGEKDGSFVRINTIFRKTLSKSGTELVSINAKLHEPQLSQLRLNSGGEYLSSGKFHTLLTVTKSKYEDEKGKPITEWHKTALCRFVKGSYTNRDGEYYSLEVIYKQGYYFVHFFSYDDTELIKVLEKTGQKKFNWIQAPEKIDFKEPTEQFSF